MATPFVQGQLRDELLTFSVRTECAHCGEPIEIQIDRDLHCRVLSGGPEPMIFAPLVDFAQLADPSIIDAF
jgi:hypothetical protein